MRKISKHTPEQIVVKLEKAEALRGEGMSAAQPPPTTPTPSIMKSMFISNSAVARIVATTSVERILFVIANISVCDSPAPIFPGHE